MTAVKQLRYSLEPIDESYFRTAPMRWSYELDLPATADEVWRQLTLERPLTWCRALSDIVFNGAPPFGLGAGRSIQVLHLLRMQEYFFRWDDTRRIYSFYVTHASLPLFTSFAEDYEVVSNGSGCRLIWTFAMTPRRGLNALLRAGRPMNNALFNSFAKDTKRHFSAG